nr:hypothetical protein [Hordeum vulgare subsp. vulgare]
MASTPGTSSSLDSSSCSVASFHMSMPSVTSTRSSISCHRIKFGNLEYIADARGDLVLTGLSVSSNEPVNPEVLPLGLLPGPVFG